jgi:hypothetical protein
MSHALLDFCCAIICTTFGAWLAIRIERSRYRRRRRAISELVIAVAFIIEDPSGVETLELARALVELGRSVPVNRRNAIANLCRTWITSFGEDLPSYNHKDNSADMTDVIDKLHTARHAAIAVSCTNLVHAKVDLANIAASAVDSLDALLNALIRHD